MYCIYVSRSTFDMRSYDVMRVVASEQPYWSIEPIVDWWPPSRHVVHYTTWHNHHRLLALPFVLTSFSCFYCVWRHNDCYYVSVPTLLGLMIPTSFGMHYAYHNKQIHHATHMTSQNSHRLNLNWTTFQTAKVRLIENDVIPLLS